MIATRTSQNPSALVMADFSLSPATQKGRGCTSVDVDKEIQLMRIAELFLLGTRDNTALDLRVPYFQKTSDFADYDEHLGLQCIDFNLRPDSLIRVQYIGRISWTPHDIPQKLRQSPIRNQVDSIQSLIHSDYCWRWLTPLGRTHSDGFHNCSGEHY